MSLDLQTSVEIDAPPARVWQVLSDAERWPEWTQSMTSVRLLDGPLAVGHRARIKQPRLPAIVWTVTQLTPGEGFTWGSDSRGATTVADHRIVPTVDGTRVTLSIHQTGLLNALLRPLIQGMSRRYLEMEAQGLKRRCEAGL